MPSWKPKLKQNDQQTRSRELGSDAPPPYASQGGSMLSRDGSTYERVASATTHADPAKFLTDLLSSNPNIVSKNNIADPFQSMKEVEDDVANFADTAKTMVKGLTALGHIHPFVGIAVGAFALVVTLDLTRRENDRKIVAVKVQMCDLMAVFFELRHIKSSQEKGPDGTTIAERLTPLMRDIAKDVKECGAACDAISKKGFLAKTVKASVYEGRLAEWSQTFLDRRKSLELSLSLHSAVGIDAANKKLDDQHGKLQNIERKLEMMMVFRKLDTPREKDVRKFIEDNGGAKACVANDELLEELVTRSGETGMVSAHAGAGSGRGGGGRDAGRRTNESLPDVKKRLMKELSEDIDEAFSRNMVLFERKLDVQSKQLVETMKEESENVVRALLAGAHDRITDPDLQIIWKDMGWKGSVKARHFVLALHDYYTDQLSMGSSSPSSSTLTLVNTDNMSGLPSPNTPGSRMSLMPPGTPSTPRHGKRADDEWALAYINAAYVQPILEAVDDDGTGFVSVKEVNTFVAERPGGWSLPHWIAYWAVGWQVSMSRYKSRIYSLVQTMFRTLAHVLPSNRRAVDEYLFHQSFWRIELLLRSTRDAGGKVESDPDLLKATISYERTEEERLENALEDVGYELDTKETVGLMTGAGRIERYAMPLIYLLLKRHLRVITLSCKHVVHTDEFATLTESLVSILSAVDQRMQNLEAIFKQTHLDVQARLGNFAFGMFQLSYGDIKRCPAENSFATWVDPEGDSNSKRRLDLDKEDVIAEASEVSHDILKYGIQDGYSVTDYFEFEPHRLVAQSPLQGTWTGHYMRMFGDEPVSCMLRLSIRVSSNARRFIGKGEDFAEAFEFSGDVSLAGEDRLDVTFLVVNDKDGSSRRFSGSLDIPSGVIIAHWTGMRRDGASDSSGSIADAFELRCTSPTLLRYRYSPVQFAEDPARSRWSFACAAVLHQAQEKLWSRRFFEARFTERKRYVELTTRSLIVQGGLTPQNPLKETEKRELEYLREELNPSEARFYQALAEFEIQKLPWHPSWGCDWCERQITKRRMLCIQCMSEDYADNIDLCETCLDKAPMKRTFSHQATHSLVQVEQTLHDFDLIRVIESARTTSERLKARFRAQETSLLRAEGDATSGDRLLCACCGVPTLPSCWGCVVCTRDTVICRECNTKRTPSRQDSHLLTHPLVRICDTTVDGDTVTTEERLLAMEQRLHLMEIKVANNFELIESRMTERLNAMEAKMDERLTQMEAKMDQRLESLEMVLRHIAAQTAALPAVYGTVIRDHGRGHTIRNSH